MSNRSARTRLSFVAALAVGLAFTACASTSTADSGEGSRNVITRAEITESNAMTAYEVVRQLRPAFLQGRRARSIEGDASQSAVVYVDGVYRGELRELELINANDVQEIMYLDATDATQRFGTGHTGGAIMVTTRAG